jgi:5-methylthioadenosine/S-adenosylhomocysteine deaminase
MTAPLALFRARWVLPVTAPPIHDGAVLVDGEGRIAAVGRAGDIAPPEGADVHELGETALLPGLVNVHMHLELSVMRGLLDDLAFTDWIPALLAARRNAGLDEDDFAAATRWSLVEAVAAGITTVGATEDSAAGFHALRESGQRGVVFREVFGPAPAQCNESVARLGRQLAAMRDAETDRVRVGVSPHAPYTVSEPLFRAVARLAIDQDVPIAIHAAESEAESKFVAEGGGVFADRLRRRGIAVEPRARSTIAWLDVLGVLEARPLLIHCVQVDERDVRRIADSGSTVAHCAIANARLGHGTAPLAALLDAGVTVGLGTDSVASNNRVDLLEEGRVAQLLQRSLRQDPAALPSERLLRLATLDGARALGLDGRIGSLDVGKDADLCAVSLAAPHARPVHDPCSALFHAARGSDVVLTVAGGRVLYRNGRFFTLDAAAAGAAVERLAARVREAWPGSGVGPA